MFGKLFGIAANSFIETVRQPIYLVILGVTAFLMIMNVGLAAFTLDDDDKLLMDLGLSTLLLSGMFLASFSAAGVLSREIENKTALTVISKPVSRTTFLGGKYLGLLAALVVAFYISFMVFVMTQRHAVLQTSADPWDWPVIAFGFGGLLLVLLGAGFCNYFYDMEFASTAVGWAVPVFTVAVGLIACFDEEFKVQTFWDGMIAGQPIAAACLVLCGVLLLAAVALAASTRLGQISTLLTCAAVLAIGLISDYAFGRHAEDSAVAAAVYRIVPNLSLIGVTQALHSDEIIVPGSYVWMTAAYCGLYVAAALLIGVALFQTREVG
ncbi:MAG: ABC transporter permease [Phycisphaerales bacterium]|nr:MAG: ABC transporter permease [Phycisphaerales bacterium]